MPEEVQEFEHLQLSSDVQPHHLMQPFVALISILKYNHLRSIHYIKGARDQQSTATILQLLDASLL